MQHHYQSRNSLGAQWVKGLAVALVTAVEQEQVQSLAQELPHASNLAKKKKKKEKRKERKKEKRNKQTIQVTDLK